MGFFSRLLLGNGTLSPEVRSQLEAEGLVLVEEGLVGSVRYENFRAPGKRFDGKVRGVCVAIGISESRIVVYSHSGRNELIDSRFDQERLAAVGIEAVEGRIVFTVDYAKLDVPDVTGVITIRARTERAAEIAEQVRARL